MRIVYIGAFRFPNHDAAAARVLNVARAMRLSGHEVSFISWGGVMRKGDHCQDGKYRIDGFEYEVTDEIDSNGGLFKRIMNKLTRGNRTKKLLKKRLGTYDTIITYNGSITRWLVNFAEKHHLKLISDLTEWYDYNELKVIDWLPNAVNMHFTQKRIKNKIVISSYLDKFYNTSHNIVIPATCDAMESKWHKGKEDVFKTIGEYDGITLIYAGNPARKDVIHYAINAVQRLIEEGAKLRFLIVGIERECYLKRYSSLLTNKNLNPEIQFCGRVSQDDVPRYYAASDFMVLLREQTRKSNAGFPTKFAEAFTSGTPVIANMTSDLGKYLTDGVTGFVVAEPSEMAMYQTMKEKVLKLNRNDIENIKNNVREAAKQLDFHAYVQPLRTFLEEL